MRVLPQVVNVLMMVVFLGSAVLQYNDDDAFRWAAVYLIASACCIAAAVGKLKWWLPAIVAVVCLGWAAVYLAHGAWSLTIRQAFAEWGMRTPKFAAMREMVGLAVIAVWMILLALLARRSAAIPV